MRGTYRKRERKSSFEKTYIDGNDLYTYTNIDILDAMWSLPIVSQSHTRSYTYIYRYVQNGSMKNNFI